MVVLGLDQVGGAVKALATEGLEGLWAVGSQGRVWRAEE